MLTSHAFRPYKLGTQRVNVGATVYTITLQYPNTAGSIYVENRGSTDLLIELGDTDPVDTQSFPIPAMTSQPIGVGTYTTIKAKRPAGSTAELAIFSEGEGL